MATPNPPKVHSAQSKETLSSNMLGYIRLGTATFVTAICCAFLSVIGLFNVRIKGIPMACWAVIPFARMINVIFNIDHACHDLETLKNHKGIIVANHSSLLDVITFAMHMPVRFLAAIEVKHRPMLGRIASLVGVIFVTRDDLHSRNAATSEIVRALKEQPNLPIIIFPEGRIGDGRVVGEFQRGAFWIAAKNDFSVLPCAIEYTPEEAAVWDGDGECFDDTIWPLAIHRGGVRTTLTVLEPFRPALTDDPNQLAFETRREIAQTLGFAE